MVDWRYSGLLAALLLQAQGQPAVSILGEWRGSSLCADRRADPACADEQVIYRIDSTAGSPMRVRVRADKVVNGVREDMGDLHMQYDSTAHAWFADLTMRLQVRWSFQALGDTLTGSLTELPSGRLIRRVRARRFTPS